MPRKPDKRINQAKEVYLSGIKLDGSDFLRHILLRKMSNFAGRFYFAKSGKNDLIFRWVYKLAVDL